MQVYSRGRRLVELALAKQGRNDKGGAKVGMLGTIRKSPERPYSSRYGGWNKWVSKMNIHLFHPLYLNNTIHCTLSSAKTKIYIICRPRSLRSTLFSSHASARFKSANKLKWICQCSRLPSCVPGNRLIGRDSYPNKRPLVCFNIVPFIHSVYIWMNILYWGRT